MCIHTPDFPPYRSPLPLIRVKVVNTFCSTLPATIDNRKTVGSFERVVGNKTIDGREEE